MKTQRGIRERDRERERTCKRACELKKTSEIKYSFAVSYQVANHFLAFLSGNYEFCSLSLFFIISFLSLDVYTLAFSVPYFLIILLFWRNQRIFVFAKWKNLHFTKLQQSQSFFSYIIKENYLKKINQMMKFKIFKNIDKLDHTTWTSFEHFIVVVYMS